MANPYSNALCGCTAADLCPKAQQLHDRMNGAYDTWANDINNDALYKQYENLRRQASQHDKRARAA